MTTEIRMDFRRGGIIIGALPRPIVPTRGTSTFETATQTSTILILHVQSPLRPRFLTI